ncbi:uracil-DNA glycosylase, family 4 [Haloplanus vescus]|uniref:Uracil-DNA glycosylase, family 4 n=1 Tax=Haloplanus vescus TaxID=555874 RepID=A0A1H3VZV9_9EURY|nr:uracil-DNA glycosylase, family 4 [Haloplanus vescus]
MDPAQESPENPFGMDADCQNCADLCETRTNVVHGYGDAGAEFLFVGGQPSPGADRTGIPFTGDDTGRRLQYILGELGFSNSSPDADRPELDNAYLTYLTRCHHPERGPTDAEITTCDPYLTADLRMINPEIIVPIGTTALRGVAVEHTTRDPETLDADDLHATTVRGRGFELVPMKSLDDQTDADTEAFVEHLAESVLGRDYRQTKGRSGAHD